MEKAPVVDPGPLALEVGAECLADLFDVTARRVRQLVEEGLPKAGPDRYPLRDCVRWFLGRWKAKATGGDVSASYNEARARKVTAEAACREVELALLKRSSLPTDEVGRAWEAAAVAIRSQFRSIPPRLGPLVAIEEDPLRCRDLLAQAIDEALEEIASAEIKPSPPEHRG